MYLLIIDNILRQQNQNTKTFRPSSSVYGKNNDKNKINFKLNGQVI